MSALDEHAADIVRHLPTPPRAVSLWALVRRLYRTQAARWFLGIGLILGLPVTLLFGFVAEGELWRRVGTFLGLAFTAFFVAMPGIGAIRLSRALNAGLRVEGEILTSQWSGPGLRPATIETGTHGWAVGTRRVFHPTGPFDEQFESDSRWAQELTAGTRIALLVHPTTPRVLFDLGPAD